MLLKVLETNLNGYQLHGAEPLASLGARPQMWNLKIYRRFLGVLLEKQLECEAEKNEIKSDMNGRKKFFTCIFYRDLLKFKCT